MVSADETPVRGAGLSNGKAEQKGKKGEKRSRKPRQKTQAKPDQVKPDQVLETEPHEVLQTQPDPVSEIQEEIGAPVASMESAGEETASVETASIAPVAPVESSPVETAPVDPIPAAPVAAMPAAPVNLQTISNAYGDFTRKSLEQTSSFFEQLVGVRSLNRAVELQTEYAKQALETFVAESERIRGLHRELNRQRWRSFEGFVTGVKTTRAK